MFSYSRSVSVLCGLGSKKDCPVTSSERPRANDPLVLNVSDCRWMQHNFFIALTEHWYFLCYSCSCLDFLSVYEVTWYMHAVMSCKSCTQSVDVEKIQRYYQRKSNFYGICNTVYRMCDIFLFLICQFNIIAQNYSFLSAFRFPKYLC